MREEVLSYAPDAYVDEGKTQVGYEISFTKYFYRPEGVRGMGEILCSLRKLRGECDKIMWEIEEEIK